MDWDVVRLGEVGVEFFGGGTPSTKKPEYWNGDIQWTTSAYINGLYLQRGAKKITHDGLSNSTSRLVPKNNLGSYALCVKIELKIDSQPLRHKDTKGLSVFLVPSCLGGF